MYGEGNGNPLQYSCLENPHGQSSLAGYSPLGCKELDITERLRLSLSSPLLPQYPDKFLNDMEGNAISLWFLVPLSYCQLVIHF